MKDEKFNIKMNAHTKAMKESVEAPFDIEKEILKISEKRVKKEKKIMKIKILKRTALSLAGAFCACMLAFNCVPSLAYAVSDIPVLGNAVEIITFGRFQLHENGFEANVVTPKIEGLLDKELEEKLNKEFKENSDTVISAFESDIKELKKEFGDEETIHLGVDADYVVRTDNDKILAIDCYITNIAGSSSTTHKFYNIDKKTDKLLTLKDMFKKNADYVTPISEYIIKQMKEENKNNDGMYWVNDEMMGNFEKIKDNQNFFINDSGNIVICFDKYEVAAGAQGCPEFEIPNSVVKEITK